MYDRGDQRRSVIIMPMGTLVAADGGVMETLGEGLQTALSGLLLGFGTKPVVSNPITAVNIYRSIEHVVWPEDVGSSQTTSLFFFRSGGFRNFSPEQLPDTHIAAFERLSSGVLYWRIS